MGFFSKVGGFFKTLGSGIKKGVQTIGKFTEKVLDNPVTNSIISGLDLVATAVPILQPLARGLALTKNIALPLA